MAKKPNWQNRIIESGIEDADQLLAHPFNARIHPQFQQQALEGVLDSIGWVQRVIVNKTTGHVVDGHLRVALAITHNEQVPVDYVELTEDEEKAILASFDYITTLAAYDKDQLDTLLKQVNSDDARVQELLSKLAEDVGLYRDPPAAPEAQIDRAAELQRKWQVERGQLWEIGKHRLLCGDSTNADDVARVMGGELARLVVTSPPYNQNLDTFKPSGMQKEQPAFVNRMANAYADSLPEDEYQSQQITLIEMLCDFLTDDGSVFYNHKIRYRDKSVVSPYEWLSKLSIPIRQEIIWDRGGSITLNARMFMPADERIYWLRTGDDFVFNDTPEIKAWSTVWKIAAHNDVPISAAFATEIPTRCIMAASEPDDIVLEPYGGSGTTMVACEQLGRQCRMIEIEPKYCAVILERMTAMGLTPRLVE